MPSSNLEAAKAESWLQRFDVFFPFPFHVNPPIGSMLGLLRRVQSHFSEPAVSWESVTCHPHGFVRSSVSAVHQERPEQGCCSSELLVQPLCWDTLALPKWKDDERIWQTYAEQTCWFVNKPKCFQTHYVHCSFVNLNISTKIRNFCSNTVVTIWYNMCLIMFQHWNLGWHTFQLPGFEDAAQEISGLACAWTFWKYVARDMCYIDILLMMDDDGRSVTMMFNHLFQHIIQFYPMFSNVVYSYLDLCYLISVNYSVKETHACTYKIERPYTFITAEQENGIATLTSPGLGVVDCDQHQTVCAKQNLRKTPAVMLYPTGNRASIACHWKSCTILNTVQDQKSETSLMKLQRLDFLS